MVVASPSDVSEVEGGRFATKIECHDARSEGLSRLKLGGIFFVQDEVRDISVGGAESPGWVLLPFFLGFLGKTHVGWCFFSVVSERGGVDCQWVFACKV